MNFSELKKNNDIKFDAISFSGQPGVGKGFIIDAMARQVAQDYNIENYKDIILSTGNIARKYRDVMPEFDYALNEGTLIKTSALMPYVEEEILQLKKKYNNVPILFDGFPRNIEQLEMCDKSDIKILYYYIYADEQLCIERLNKRARDRFDMNIENQNRRLEEYKNNTKPMIDKLIDEDRIFIVENYGEIDSRAKAIEIYDQLFHTQK